MANPRATFFFEFRKWGWSETHWLNRPSALQDFRDIADTLGRARIMLLAIGVRLTYVRVSDDAVFRDSLIIPGYTPNANTQVYNPDLKASPADVPSTVALLRAESGPLYRKSIYLGGIPDDDVMGGVYTPDSAWLSAYNRWVRVLKSDWAFKAKNHDQGSNPSKPFTDFLSATPPIFTSPNHGLANGDTIRISGFTGVGANPNGIRTVGAVIDANKFSLFGFTSLFQPLRLGQWQKQVNIYAPYTDILIRGVGHRKRGRPFDSPVGRRRTRRARP